MARFYRMAVLPNLFGEWTLAREWGRIGRPGQLRLDCHESRTGAEAAFVALKRRKMRRGYTVRIAHPSPIHLSGNPATPAHTSPATCNPPMCHDDQNFPGISDFLRRPAPPQLSSDATEGKGDAPGDGFQHRNTSMEREAPDGYSPYLIHNGMEIPALPCGRRTVHAKRGRKWVFIWRGKGRFRARAHCRDFDRIVID